MLCISGWYDSNISNFLFVMKFLNIFPDDIPLPTIEIPATLKLELPNMHG